MDVLSSIPFNAIDPTGNILPLFGMLKLIRVSRITQVIRNLNSMAESKAALRVLWLIFFVFLYIHLMACLWSIITQIDEEWLPPKDTIYGEIFEANEYYDSAIGRQYLLSFYTAYYLMTSGEIAPRTDTEVIVAFVIMLISSMILANLIALITVLNAEINHKTI